MASARNTDNMLDVASSGDLDTAASSLMQIRDDKTIETLYVTSCNPGEGKTVVAIKFALAASRDIGLRVLLVDCNPARPVVAKVFGIEDSPGFLELLSNRVDPGEVVRTTMFDNLHIAPFGSPTQGHLNIYSSDNLRAKLRVISDSIFGGYDLLIIDGPSGSDRPDLSMGAAAFDAVALVIECERTRWEVAKNYAFRLSNAPASVAGVVLNKRKFYIPKIFYA